MKLINARGRILLEVTAADAELVRTASGLRLTNIRYTYHGDGISGRGSLDDLASVIVALRTSNPGARMEGLLPDPLIRERDKEGS